MVNDLMRYSILSGEKNIFFEVQTKHLLIKYLVLIPNAHYNEIPLIFFFNRALVYTDGWTLLSVILSSCLGCTYVRCEKTSLKGFINAYGWMLSR